MIKSYRTAAKWTKKTLNQCQYFKYKVYCIRCLSYQIINVTKVETKAHCPLENVVLKGKYNRIKINLEEV